MDLGYRSISPAEVNKSSSLISVCIDTEFGGNHYALPLDSITAGPAPHGCSSAMVLGQRGWDWEVYLFLSLKYLLSSLQRLSISLALMWSHRQLGINTLDYFD